MPLSENEQRMLEQMERALYEEDPKFATQLKGSDARAFYRKRLALAAGIFHRGETTVPEVKRALAAAGVPVTFQILEGHVHPSFAFTRLIPSARRYETDAIAAVRAALHP